MKTIVSLALILVSLNVFAGPEERKEQQKCYTLNTASAPYNPSENFPAAVCFEALKLDSSARQLSVQSYFTPQYFKNLKVETVAFNKSGQAKFRATSLVYEKYGQSCSHGEVMTLVIEGVAARNGTVNPAALKLSVVHSTSNDTCHSKMSPSTFKYKLK